MQSVRYFLRAIGDASKSPNVVSSQQAEDDLNYNYLSQGYEVQSSIYVGSIKDTEGNEIGYRILHVLLKDETPKKVAVKEPK